MSVFMSQKGRWFLMIALVGTLASLSPSAEAAEKVLPDKQRAKLLNQFRTWLKSIKTYTVVADALIKIGNDKKKLVGTSKLSGITHERMRIEMTMPFPNRVRGNFTHRMFTIIYGKRWQWVVTGMYAGKTAKMQRCMKIDRQKLAPPDEPFQTMYTVRGAGVSAGRDFPATFLELLQIYPVESAVFLPNQQGGMYRLRGKLDPQMAFTYLQKMSPWMKEGMIKMKVNMLKRMADIAILVLDAKTLHPVELTQLSSKKGTRSMSNTMRYKDLHTNVALSPKMFTYTPKKGMAVRDITSALLQRKAMLSRPAPQKTTPSKAPSTRPTPRR